MSKKLEDYTKEELIEIVRDLKSRKKFGLVWEDKPEDVVRLCETELPILEEVPQRTIQRVEGASNNLIIEGDNYHSLSVLNYTHNGSIDLIYIDPPYNTGSSSWRYNNDYVDSEDPWKHSKWLSFMSKRLKLAKNLLKKDGGLIVAIDDYELNQLGLLLEELFPDYERNLIILEHHPQGAGSNTVSRTHEYAYICTPSGIGFKGRKSEEKSGNWSLKRTGQGENNWRVNRPNQFFAILVDTENKKVVGVGPNIPKDNVEYPTGNTEEGYKRIYPLDRENKERAWRYNPETMKKLIAKGDIIYTDRGALIVQKNIVNASPVFSIWKDPKYNAGTYGTALLTKIMGTTNTFPYPKSLFTVKDMIELIIGNNEKALVLDFFAGSGTTGHAILQLNDEDGGERRFILCTNNENKIAEEICYPRIKNVIDGYATVEGIPSNVRYFKTGFVSKEQTNDQTRAELVARSTDMICLREDTFEKVFDDSLVKIFGNADQYAAIIFDPEAIGLLKDALAELQDDKPVHIYIFSLSNDTYESDFFDLERSHEVRPIPESILEVYRRIFTSQNKTMGGV